MRGWFGSAGAERQCAPAALGGRFCGALNFTVSRLLKNPTDRAEFGERTERS
jgi:hypothetical protein